MRGLLVLLVMLCGCRLEPPGRAYPDPRPPGVGPRRDTLPEVRLSGLSSPSRRQICRTEGVPAGWAIRSYETDRDRCPRPGEEPTYNVAVIEDLRWYRRGDVIGICADQPVPRGWSPSPAAPILDCPGAGVRPGEATAVSIRKD